MVWPLKHFFVPRTNFMIPSKIKTSTKDSTRGLHISNPIQPRNSNSFTQDISPDLAVSKCSLIGMEHDPRRTTCEACSKSNLIKPYRFRTKAMHQGGSYVSAHGTAAGESVRKSGSTSINLQHRKLPLETSTEIRERELKCNFEGGHGDPTRWFTPEQFWQPWEITSSSTEG